MARDPDKLADDAMRLLESGRLQEARALYEEICRLTPGNADAWLMAAAISADSGLTTEAHAMLRHAIELDPAFAEAHLALATLLRNQSQLDDALRECNLALDADQDYAEAWLLKSAIAGALGQYAQAVDSARRCVALSPECAEAWVNMGQGLDALGKHEEAIEQYRLAASIEPRLVAAYAGMAESLTTLGRLEEAETACAEAAPVAPGDPTLSRARGRLLQRLGRNQEACAILEPLIAAGTLDAGAAVALAWACSRLGRAGVAAPVIEAMLAQTSALTEDMRWQLHSALGRLYDDMAEYDRAFEHVQRGQQLKRGNFDPDAHRALIDRWISYFSAERMAQLPRAGIESDRPVFIVGMPRSGTTLVEQILSSHPAVSGAGELFRLGEIAQRLPATLASDSEYPFCLADLTPQAADDAAHEYLHYLRGLGGDAARVTDKLPGNFMHLGLIDLLFPNARVIHCMRDPLDTCLSCYFQNFAGHEYVHDLSHLGAFYRDYQRLMQHWRSVLRIPVLEVQYEELVEDAERGSRMLVEFCGLPWDDSCLRFYENERSVITSSYDQVRQPVYHSSVQRWRHYERHLAPLRTALAADTSAPG